MGPLKGIKVIEFSALGPGPFCGMVLADLGAEVIVIDRLESAGQKSKTDIASRGKKSIAIDLKKKESINLIKDIVKDADVVIEGLRPGKMEKLEMGPSDFFKVNPKLIYGRMTGWGQFGLHASDPGHDINYIALTGALSSIGIKSSPPTPPLNLVGDFGGGGMLLAMGICAALVEVAKSGKGQVIDSAMTDGSALLMSMMYGFYSAGIWTDHRESNLLDGAAHFYGCYECKDGKYVSVGSIEPQFYEELVKRLELDREKFKDQMDRSRWSELKKIMEKSSWKEHAMNGARLWKGDICFAPVLSLEESINYKHNKERETFIDIDGVIQPAPAPRFSNTPGKIQHSPVEKGKHTREIIKSIGKENLIEELLKSKIIAEG